ncbi:hypothetical protein ACQEVF_10205 [Nonomuraea polychroma]|uniref:hypothetical protein n=1 Tax=Nonomuraea polychroma TaxID=46176 RepID=UPI003D93D20B
MATFALIHGGGGSAWECHLVAGGVVRDRLGVTPDEIAGGHAPMLARPKELVDYLTGRS